MSGARKRSRRCRRRPQPLLSCNASNLILGLSQAEADRSIPQPSPHFCDSTSMPGCLRRVPPPPPEDRESETPEMQVDSGNTSNPIPDAAVSAVHNRNVCTPAPEVSDNDNQDEELNYLAANVDDDRLTAPDISDNDNQDEELIEVVDNYLAAYVDNENPTFAIFDDVEGTASEDEHDEDMRDYWAEPQADTNDMPSDQFVSKLVLTAKKMMSRPVLLACISLYGKCRYTIEHYEHLVIMMRDCNNGVLLPSAATMRKVIFPRMCRTLFVQSSIESFPRKSGFSNYLTRSTWAQRQCEAVVVLPSSWAKLDVRSLYVLREIACIERCRCGRQEGTSDLRIDTSNHVTQRKSFSRHSDVLWVNRDGEPVASKIGMTVGFHTADRSTLSEISSHVPELRFRNDHHRGNPCKSFNGIIVSTIHVCYTVERGVYLEVGEQPRPMTSDVKHQYDQCLGYIENLCRINHDAISSSEDDVGDDSGNEAPQTRRQRKKSRKSTTIRTDEELHYLIPSDHLTIVKLEGSSSFGVFVSRYWVRRLDDDRNVFMFISSASDGTLRDSMISTIGTASFIKDAGTSNEACADGSLCRTIGRLRNGMKYYVYRIILYADDFTQRSTLFPKGSVGGLYMSPSSLHIKSRRSQTSIRTVSLTPPGVSTNEVLHFLIEDLVTGSLDGFICTDAFGERVTVFFDIMGFIGDYPASSGVVDLRGHNAIAPCTVCGFTYNNDNVHSKYASTTSVHSRNSSYRRTQSRTESVRAAGITKMDCKCIGMSFSSSDNYLQSSACPLLNLAARCNSHLQTSSDVPDFSSFKMDGYQLNIVAPDHLISGLFKGVLTIVFIQLTKEDIRDNLQILLRSALSTFGFQSQSVLFKSKTRKLVPGLSMSTIYCILTVLPSCLKALDALDSLPSAKMLLNLHRFFSTAFWWPAANTDGLKAWHFVHGSRMNAYHRSLQIIASNFIKSVDKFVRNYPLLACHIDRPNVHRLLELTTHTIPLYNHMRYICELVFESSHQPLKFFLSRNHSLNSHVYAVQLVLAQDWMTRLWHLWYIYRSKSEKNSYKHYAFVGLLRLLFGVDVDSINWRSPAVSVHLEELREHVHSLMIGTVENRLEKWYGDGHPTYNSSYSWILYPPPRRFAFTMIQKSFFDSTRDKLAQFCMCQTSSIQICHKALLDRGHASCLLYTSDAADD